MFQCFCDELSRFSNILNLNYISSKFFNYEMSNLETEECVQMVKSFYKSGQSLLESSDCIIKRKVSKTSFVQSQALENSLKGSKRPAESTTCPVAAVN